jgi:hypothetical protein
MTNEKVICIDREVNIYVHVTEIIKGTAFVF